MLVICVSADLTHIIDVPAAKVDHCGTRAGYQITDNQPGVLHDHTHNSPSEAAEEASLESEIEGNLDGPHSSPEKTGEMSAVRPRKAYHRHLPCRCRIADQHKTKCTLSPVRGLNAPPVPTKKRSQG